MILQDILYKVAIRSVKGNTNIDIRDLQMDSRKTNSGTCFIAIKGAATDGHAFINSAIGSGAVAIVCETMPADLKEDIVTSRY